MARLLHPALLTSRVLITSLLLLMTSDRVVEGHGRLVDPPSRSSMWRYGFDTPHNYNDNGLNCGGVNTQWYVNGGKCGVCGDAWNKPQPRDNEAGGLYGKGIITRNYTPGQTVEVKLEITADHEGWFEFRLCQHNSPSTPITQQCLDQHLLQLADGSGTRYNLGPNANTLKVPVVLPQGVTCTQCVLQWKWHSANNYGTDASGKSCIGCGEVQEEFYVCSDISIGASSATATSIIPQTRPFYTNGPIKSSSPWIPALMTNPPYRPVTQQTAPPVQTYPPFQPITMRPGMVTVRTNPPYRPVTVQPTAAPVQTYPPFQPITVQPGVVATVKTYPPFNPVTDKPTTPTRPTPSSSTATTTSSTTQSTTTTMGTPPPGYSMVCVAINAWQGVPNLDQYCSEQCPRGNCPAGYCSCTFVRTTPLTSTTRSTTPLPIPTMGPTPRTIPPRPTTAPPPHMVDTPTTAAHKQTCYAINNWQGDPQLDEWCNKNCPLGVCPAQNCHCGLSVGAKTTPLPTMTPSSTPLPTTTSTTPTTPTTTTPTTTPSITTEPSTTVHVIPALVIASANEECFAIGAWAGQPQLDQWCSQTCVQYGCDRSYCACRPITTATTPSVANSGTVKCHAINGWAGQPRLDQWCDVKCPTGLCPPMYCACGPNASG